MSRRFVLRDRDTLTPDAVRAILAKELLLKASRPVEPLTGHLITARRRVFYASFAYTKASDSANQHLDDADRAMNTMLASEAVLRREWDTPEEDAAWADLLKGK